MLLPRDTNHASDTSFKFLLISIIKTWNPSVSWGYGTRLNYLTLQVCRI